MVRLNKTISALLAGIIILYSGSIAFAGLADEQQRLNQVNQQMKQAESQLKGVKNEKNSLLKELAELNNKLNEAENQLSKVESDIKVTQKELDKLSKELDEAQRKMDERDGLYKQRIRNMYINSGYGYVEVLLDAENFGDLVSRLYLVSKVASYDLSVLEEMKEYRDTVQQKKDQMKEKELKMLSLKNDLVKKRKEIQLVAASRNDTLRQVQNKEKMLESMLDELEKTSREIQLTILKLQSKDGSFIGGTFVWPAPGYKRITSDFGWRVHPIYKTKKYHSGIDIGVPWGKKIVAAGNGKVIYADWYGGYGQTVMIDHGGGIVTLYAHNSSLKVKTGSIVKAGDTVAIAGSTGLSTGPHLHFEVRKNGEVVNPKPWLGL
jgi:murein DD-endopeptidase MepM/ murein hydrolase activator NlpD